MRTRRLFLPLLVMVVVLTAGLWPAAFPASHAQNTGSTFLVSISEYGVMPVSTAYYPAISYDGRYVTFSSDADLLVPEDTNRRTDVFVRDMQTGSITLVSVDVDGQASGLPGQQPVVPTAISGDGRYVAFDSIATNLVHGDNNGQSDVFVHDLQTGLTSRVSLASDGSEANAPSQRPVLSANGRYVAFYSTASNLVAGDTNNKADVFVHDRQSNTTRRVSLAADGSEGNAESGLPSISADGRFVAFASAASNLVADDTNNKMDVFVRDIGLQQTWRVSVASDGSEANAASLSPAISANGRFVVFKSKASNLVADDSNSTYDIFLHDRYTGTTSRVSLASDGSEGNSYSGLPGPDDLPAISGDGRYVVFASAASNLVTADTNESVDIFLRDTQAGITERISLASKGSQGNANSYQPAISGNGQIIAFASHAGNLVDIDIDTSLDIFLRDRQRIPSLPVVTINQVTPNPVIASQDQIVYFQGAASNPADPEARVRHWKWTSDRDGLLSSEASFSLPATVLSIGQHAIALRIMDEDGDTAMATTTLTVLPVEGSVRTLILFNRLGFARHFGPAVSEVEAGLNRLAAHSSVAGMVVRLDDNRDFRTAYENWLPGTTFITGTTTTANANLVAEATRAIVTDYRSRYPDLENLVIVGDDRLIPFYRAKTGKEYPYEQDYVIKDESIDTNITVAPALLDNTTLTDDYFSDDAPERVEALAGKWLYLPELATGRLIETPDEIIGQIDAFLANSSTIITQSTVSGWAFLQDVSLEICSILQIDGLTPVCHLIGNNFGRADYINGVVNAPYQLSTFAGHSYHVCMRMPDGSKVCASDFAATSTEHGGALFYSIGCYGGLNVGSGKNSTDLPQVMARRQINYFGNTGVGFGWYDIAFSEKLMQLFTQQLTFGASQEAGKALLNAKHEYRAMDSRHQLTDAMILMEMTLYGLPMQRYLTPGPAATRLSAGATSTPLSTVSNDGDLTVNTRSYQFPPLVQRDMAEGRYFTFGGEAQIDDGLPIQPRYTADLSFPGTEAHGVVFRGGQYTDYTDFDPVVAQALNEYVTPQEPGFAATGWTPALLTRINSQVRRATLVALLGQFHANDQIERIYRRLDLEIYYHAESADWVAPEQVTMQSALQNGVASVEVWAADASGIAAVVVAYTNNDGVWQSVNLASVDDHWSGAFPAGASTRFFVQVVDGAGNVAALDNAGNYFVPQESELLPVYLPIITAR